MPDDPPPDAISVLSQLFEEASVAIEDGDVGTALEAIGSAEAVATDDLPDGERRSAIQHGCSRVRSLLETAAGEASEEATGGSARSPPSDEEVTAAAAAYLEAMTARLPDK